MKLYRSLWDKIVSMILLSELHTTKGQLYMCPLAALDHMTVSKICTYIQGMTSHALQVYPQYIGSELEGIISMG